MNYLDEIEMELGKESMKYVCDHKGRMCAWDDSRCLHSRPHEPLHGCNETIGDCKGKCIPVEPERVKWYYRMSCATRSCAANDEGMCNVSINGLATCSKHQWPKPSPGLLQRMGMTWGCEDSPVVRLSPGTYHIGNITVVVQG